MTLGDGIALAALFFAIAIYNIADLWIDYLRWLNGEHADNE